MAKLLSSLPIGATVKFGKHSVYTEAAQPIVWLVVDKNHSGYPSNSVTLIPKQSIDLRSYDAAEVNFTIGNNNYKLSNLHQWLNSEASAGEWYTATHSSDAPPINDNIYINGEYFSRPGFLNNFATTERVAILSTPLTIYNADGTTSQINAKVFLPSLTETGYAIDKDKVSTIFQYANSNGMGCSVTQQAITNTRSNTKPSVGYDWDYWTRDSENSSVYVRSWNHGLCRPYESGVGVRPVINLSADLMISDTTDSDGCYTFSLTNAPSAPSNLDFFNHNVYTNKPCSIKWVASTDPNGDIFSYKVHIYYDGVESGDPIDVGTNTTYTLSSVKGGISSIGFAVEAVDLRGHNSEMVSITAPVYTNYAPVISGANSDLGNKSEEFSQEYTVDDADGGVVTVREYIDNVEIRSYVATLGATNTFAVTGNTWLKLTNGIHTLKIIAGDKIDDSIRTFTFIKNVAILAVERKTPLDSTTQPKSILVTVVKNIPDGAIFKVEACNNGYDTSPTWEDITTRVLQGRIYDFTNTSKTASQWGVNIRVTVDRNGSEGACYITEIGGNFE